MSGDPIAASSPRFAGRRVVMTVWNSFLTDARVTKEAETLIRAGAEVTVLAVFVKGLTVAQEMTPSGIRVQRIRKRPPFLVDAPLRVVRRLSSDAGTGPEPERFPTDSRESRSASAPKSRGRQIIYRLLSRLGAIAGMFRMAYAAWRENADVYHAHDANTLLIAWLAARLRRKPLIYDAHEISTDREGYDGWGRWVWRLEKRLTPRVAGMITTTDLRADHFVSAYNCPRPLVLQNRPRATPLPAAGALRRRLGIPDERFVVLYQGGIQPGRGLKNVVRLASRVADADFVMIGSGRQVPEIAALVKHLQVEDRVHMIPAVPLDDLPAYTVDADLGLQILRNTCLNHWTTDSNKLFEYIMAGVPVIASDFPEIRKVVTMGPFGILIDPENLNDMEIAIRRMIDDDNFRNQCRQACRAARETLSWEAQESQLLALYQTVIPCPPQ